MGITAIQSDPLASDPLMSDSLISDSAPADSGSLERFILTKVGTKTLVLPAVWVAEIVRIERSQILDLPFYDPLLIGVMHQDGRIVPLIATARLFQTEQSAPQPVLREALMVVRLGSTAGAIAHLGLVIDRAVGSQTRAELPASLFDASVGASVDASAVGSTVSNPAEPINPIDSMVLMNPSWLPLSLWKPQRWTNSARA
ncbi:MAG: chemotaxis protein CheW [Thermosynechococcaceae cyanobacterium MS004]|nr:chemotaxis protein CheW [Thermosynechococcaceae cyanobacterium MS004]